MGVSVKHGLGRKVVGRGASVGLTKSMATMGIVRALEPEIRRALPAVLTPERFTGIALSSVNSTPELTERTPISLIATLLNTA